MQKIAAALRTVRQGEEAAVAERNRAAACHKQANAIVSIAGLRRGHIDPDQEPVWCFSARPGMRRGSFPEKVLHFVGQTQQRPAGVARAGARGSRHGGQDRCPAS